MITTSHVIIGGTAAIAVGTLTKNPAAALAAGFITHIICDAVPHLDTPPRTKFINDKVIWDRNLYIFAIIDSLLAFFLTLFLWYRYFHLAIFAPFAWGALGAYLPDFIDVVPFWKNQLQALPIIKQFHRLHLGAHNLWRFRYPMPQYWLFGTLSQIAFILPCLWYILK